MKRGVAILPELFDQVRNAQREIDQARSRIRKNERENQLDEAWIAKNEARIKEISGQIAAAREEQAKMNRETLLSATRGR